MTNKINSIFALGILILASLACSFSTANLSELKFGKDKDASNAGTTFKPEDEIFAVTAVNNASGKNKAKFRVLFDKVEGAESGAVAYKLEKELEVEGQPPDMVELFRSDRHRSRHIQSRSRSDRRRRQRTRPQNRNFHRDRRNAE